MDRSRSPIRMGEPPVPGYFLRRLVRGGPWVAAQITFDEHDGYKVMLDGNWQGPSHDPWILPFMHEVFLATPCSQSEALYRIGVKRWAELHAPGDPAANPRSAVNLDKLRPPI